jgi:ParB family transcriptional regulator, chromosome partitioning protein
VLGLIEPLVLDNKGRLLAGGHRLAAIRHLKQEQPDSYEKQFPNDQIPTRSLPFDADEQPDLALQIEVAENEQRRDYTAAEVRAIANRLRAAGYVELKGRPKKGEKALMPALAVVVGKHLRTIQRYLNEDEKPTPEKSTTRVVLLQQAAQKLKQWQDSASEDEQSEAFSKQVDKFLKQVDKFLKQTD